MVASRPCLTLVYANMWIVKLLLKHIFSCLLWNFLAGVSPAITYLKESFSIIIILEVTTAAAAARDEFSKLMVAAAFMTPAPIIKV